MLLKDECKNAVQLEDELGDIIAKARAGRGLFLAQTARAADLSESQLDDIEHYRLRPREPVMRLLAETLHLNSDKLLHIRKWCPRQTDPSSSSLLVKQIQVPFGDYGENAYIAACAETRAAAVIDPGGAVEQIKAVLKENDLTLAMVLVTHAHADHIGGLKTLLAGTTGVTVVGSSLDHQAIMQGLDAEWKAAEGGTELKLGAVTIRPLATPGHTLGSVCYLVDGTCFVGDTLFAGSIGRPSSSVIYAPMLESIRSKVLGLPGDTVLLPGHGPITTVAEELEHNPFF